MKTSLISDNQPTTVIKPRETSLDSPSLGVTRRRKTRRLTAFSSPLVFPGRYARFDSALCQFTPERGTIKTFIGNQLRHSCPRPSALLFLDGDGRQRATRKSNFVRLCAFANQANRQPVAVGDEHYFAAFANFGASDSIAPFLDGTNEPSRNAAAHSILPVRSRLASKVRQTESQTPAHSHSSNLRQQVVGEPYSFGKSAHATPVFKIYKMPFRHLRLSVRGLPRPFLGDGKSDSRTCHCWSVKSCRLIMPTILTQIL